MSVGFGRGVGRGGRKEVHRLAGVDGRPGQRTGDVARGGVHTLVTVAGEGGGGEEGGEECQRQRWQRHSCLVG